MRIERRFYVLPAATLSILLFLFIVLFNSSTRNLTENAPAVKTLPIKPAWIGEFIPLPKPGLDPGLLAEVSARAESIPLLHSMLVSRNGNLLIEEYYNGSSGTEPMNIKSASKSVISALVGIAIKHGYLESLDQKVVDFLPEYFTGDMDPIKKTITIRHLLYMSSGLTSTSSDNYSAWVTSSNWIKNALNRPMRTKPGELMLYSTGDSHLISAILTVATGMNTYDFAHKYLFDPMDIHIGGWDTDPQGIYFGGNNMAMSPLDLLKFGQTYLNNGYYNGREIIPANWVAESTRKHTRSYTSFRDFDYGYYWWLYTFADQHVYFAWGYGGQFIFVIPEMDTVAVFTSSDDLRPRNSGHLEQIHDLLELNIIPLLENMTTPAYAGQ
ncbi:MAG: serine hydrolase [Balneolales bacterium]